MDAALEAEAVATDARDWVRDLRAGGATADEATARLHSLLLEAARFEVTRRRSGRSLGREAADEIAREAADDALACVQAHLEEFRGERRFTTWARKYAVVEASVRVRRHAWLGRELPLEPALEADDLLPILRSAIDELLTPHERRVLVALALNRVPIDVFAQRLGTTRGALYESLQVARRKLRRQIAACGFDVS